MEPWAEGIAAVTLFVEDLAQTKDFYARVLASPAIFEDENSVVFRLGGTMVNLLSTAAAPELVAPAPVGASGQGARAVLTIEVDDVDRICARLADLGVALLNGPMDRPWGIRTASFTDPSGHVWEVAGPPSTASSGEEPSA